MSSSSRRSHASDDHGDAPLTLLLVGKSGAGKSSAVNALCNALRGGSLESCRLVVATRFFAATEADSAPPDSEMDLHDSMTSKTAHCNTFAFRHNNHTVRLIDTPGLASTRGMAADDRHARLITHAAATNEPIHALVLVVNGSEPRMDTSVRAVLTQLRLVLPLCAWSNAILLFTHCSEGSCTVSSEELAAVLPSAPKHVLYVQMPFWSRDPNRWTASVRDEYEHLWKATMRTMRNLVALVVEMDPVVEHKRSSKSPRRRLLHGMADLHAALHDLDASYYSADGAPLAAATPQLLKAVRRRCLAAERDCEQRVQDIARTCAELRSGSFSDAFNIVDDCAEELARLQMTAEQLAEPISRQAADRCVDALQAAVGASSAPHVAANIKFSLPSRAPSLPSRPLAQPGMSRVEATLAPHVTVPPLRAASGSCTKPMASHIHLLSVPPSSSMPAGVTFPSQVCSLDIHVLPSAQAAAEASSRPGPPLSAPLLSPPPLSPGDAYTRALGLQAHRGNVWQQVVDEAWAPTARRQAAATARGEYVHDWMADAAAANAEVVANTPFGDPGCYNGAPDSAQSVGASGTPGATSHTPVLPFSVHSSSAPVAQKGGGDKSASSLRRLSSASTASASKPGSSVLSSYDESRKELTNDQVRNMSQLLKYNPSPKVASGRTFSDQESSHRVPNAIFTDAINHSKGKQKTREALLGHNYSSANITYSAHNGTHSRQEKALKHGRHTQSQLLDETRSTAISMRQLHQKDAYAAAQIFAAMRRRGPGFEEVVAKMDMRTFNSPAEKKVINAARNAINKRDN